MSNEQVEAAQQQQEQAVAAAAAPEAVEVKEQQEQGGLSFTEAQVKEMMQENEAGLKKKVQELLAEKKAAIARAEEEGVRQRGNLDEIKAFYEERDKQRQAEFEERQASILREQSENKKLNLINGMVGDYVDSESAAFLLKNMVSVENGTEVYRDFAGNVVADNAADFRKWATTNPHMSHLLRGTKATGGGASSSSTTSSGGGAAKTISVTEFEALSQAERIAFSKSNGKIVPE